MLITYPLFMFSSGLTLQNTRIVRAEGLKHVCLFWIGLCGVWICVFSQSFLKIDYKRLYTLLKNLYIFQGLKQFQFSHEYQFIISRMSNVLILRNSCSINFDFDFDYQFGVENQDSFQFQNTSANSIGLHYCLQTISKVYIPFSSISLSLTYWVEYWISSEKWKGKKWGHYWGHSIPISEFYKTNGNAGLKLSTYL